MASNICWIPDAAERHDPGGVAAEEIKGVRRGEGDVDRATVSDKFILRQGSLGDQQASDGRREHYQVEGSCHQRHPYAVGGERYLRGGVLRPLWARRSFIGCGTHGSSRDYLSWLSFVPILGLKIALRPEFASESVTSFCLDFSCVWTGGGWVS